MNIFSIVCHHCTLGEKKNADSSAENAVQLGPLSHNSLQSWCPLKYIYLWSVCSPMVIWSIIHLKNYTSKYNPLLKVYMFNLVAQGRMCGHVVVDNHGNNLMVLGRRIWDASDSHKRWQHFFSYGKHFEGEALAWHGRHMAIFLVNRK